MVGRTLLTGSVVRVNDWVTTVEKGVSCVNSGALTAVVEPKRVCVDDVVGGIRNGDGVPENGKEGLNDKMDGSDGIPVKDTLSPDPRVEAGVEVIEGR